jgi:hypothetical protein
MTPTAIFWLGFLAGLVVAGAIACFVMAAINVKRSNDARQYVTRGQRY